MSDNSILNYWGKARKLEDGSYDYHLLVYHCLDVAAVGKLWLEKSHAFLKKAANASGLSVKAFMEWFLFFLALHDIGKFRLSFQNLCPSILKILQGRDNVKLPYSVRHDQLGYDLYEEYIFDILFNTFFKGLKSIPLKEYFDIFAFSSFGHHGLPPKSCRVCKNLKVIEEYIDTVSQFFLSKKSIEEIKSIFLLSKSERYAQIEGFKLFSWQLAGLTTLCDWIASGDDSFVFCSNEKELDEYFRTACKNAELAIASAEIVSTPISKIQGMNRLFPKFSLSPTPLQKFCNETPVNGKAQLWILEDVTGAGKTEAALTLASRILGAGGGTGCFVALPTMATSNAMYERMAEVYHRLYEDGTRPSLTLSHGSRHMSETFRSSYSDSLNNLSHLGEVSDEDIDEGQAHCSQWLADSSKKALLADVGVGTIDQILLAGLPVRYQSLRAFGMSQKVLIIDEVHSFDAYMLRLLENIISAQAAFGGSVILLSATIPFLVRERFCEVFTKGLDSGAFFLEEKKGFPLVTSVTNEGILETNVNTRSSVARSVSVEFYESVEDVYLLIEESIQACQCVCWIRNTISDVAASYEELTIRGIKKLDMFHSRFALKDRLEIEKRVLKHFRIKSKQEEREGQILIASQVVEQSLDLDFDVMISDLAPVDLLIQRAGRLHRHEREGRTDPVFYVYTPADCENPSSEWYAEAFSNARWVYKDTAMLWRTKEILKRRKKLKMPDEARLLIDSVYGEEALEVPDVFVNSEDKVWSQQMADKSLADFNQLVFKHGYSSLAGHWDKEERVSTRLSDETNTIYLCRWDGEQIHPFYRDSRFSWDISFISVSTGAKLQEITGIKLQVPA